MFEYKRLAQARVDVESPYPKQSRGQDPIEFAYSRIHVSQIRNSLLQRYLLQEIFRGEEVALSKYMRTVSAIEYRFERLMKRKDLAKKD